MVTNGYRLTILNFMSLKEPFKVQRIDISLELSLLFCQNRKYEMTQFISDGINLHQETVFKVAKVIQYYIHSKYKKYYNNSIYSYLGRIRAYQCYSNCKQLLLQAAEKEKKLEKTKIQKTKTGSTFVSSSYKSICFC